MKSLCTIYLLLSALASVSSGAEKPQRAGLPADGAWVRYYVEQTDSNGNEQIERFTVKLVGTQRENGETHRWLEFKRTRENDAKAGYVFKFLIREKDLLTGTNPIAKAVRIWEKMGDGEVENPLPNVLHPENFDILFGPRIAFLPGTIGGAKRVEQTKSVDYQNGRLEMRHGLTVQHEAGYRSVLTKVKYRWKTDITMWRHEKVPFGFAAAKMTSKAYLDGKKRYERTTTYTIEAWGTDAKTELPKHR